MASAPGDSVLSSVGAKIHHALLGSSAPALSAQVFIYNSNSSLEIPMPKNQNHTDLCHFTFADAASFLIPPDEMGLCRFHAQKHRQRIT